MNDHVKLPTLFVSHGAPDILISGGDSQDSFQQLAATLPTPKAIVIVSAHWISGPVGITDMDQLDTVHDFGGFQPELYTMNYPARGNHALSGRLSALLEEKGFETKLQPNRGLDHGAWMPLKLMYPEASIPVVQVSLPESSLTELVDFGEALKPLTVEGVLIIGSGGTVHNLREIKRNSPPDSWALEFDSWLKDRVEGNHFHDLVNVEQFPDNFLRAHPTLEHYAPIIVAWAAGNWKEPGRRVHQSFCYGNVAISHYLFGSGTAEMHVNQKRDN